MSESEAREKLQSGLYGTPTVLEITLGPPQELSLTVEPTTALSRQVWTGNVVGFARRVKADWDALPEPKPTMAAFTRLYCDQWERSEHRRFSPDSIKSLLRKDRRKAEGRPL